MIQCGKNEYWININRTEHYYRSQKFITEISKLSVMQFVDIAKDSGAERLNIDSIIEPMCFGQVHQQLYQWGLELVAPIRTFHLSSANTPISQFFSILL